MANGTIGCIKFILGTFNLILLIPAITIIVLGSSALIVPQRIDQVVDPPTKSATLLIIIGVIIFIIAFLGCWGSIKENQCMLLSYASILSIIVIIQMIIGGIFFAFRHKAKDVAEKKFTDLVNSYNFNNASDPKNEIVDDLQKNLKCCGAEGVKDYKNQIPPSCCPDSTNCSAEVAYSQGCIKAIMNLITDNYASISLFVVVFALIQIFGILLSCLLARSIRASYHVV